MMRGAVTLIQTPSAKKKRILITENSRWRLEGIVNEKQEVETFYVIETAPLEKIKTFATFEADEFMTAIDMIRKKY